MHAAKQQPPVHWRTIYSSDAAWLVAPMGEFALDLVPSTDQTPTSSRVLVANLERASFSSCPSAATMPDENPTAQLILGPTEQPVFLHFGLAAPASLTVHSDSAIGDGLEAELCASCLNGSAVECVPMLMGELGYDKRDVPADFYMKLSFTPAQHRLLPLLLRIERPN